MAAKSIFNCFAGNHRGASCYNPQACQVHDTRSHSANLKDNKTVTSPTFVTRTPSLSPNHPLVTMVDCTSVCECCALTAPFRAKQMTTTRYSEIFGKSCQVTRSVVRSRGSSGLKDPLIWLSKDHAAIVALLTLVTKVASLQARNRIKLVVSTVLPSRLAGANAITLGLTGPIHNGTGFHLRQTGFGYPDALVRFKSITTF